MRADTLTFAQLFGADVQYVVPMFQRPYVWEKARQWEPLWQDVMDVTDGLLDAYARQNGDRVKAEQSIAPHFLGAVVLDPLPTGAGRIGARHVIDGQQRLTTVQLLISAVHAVAGRHPELGRHQRIFERLLRNDKDLVEPGQPDQVYKVWPTKFDRQSFRSAMSGELGAKGRPADAYKYFKEACEGWALEGAAAGDLIERFDALQAVIRSYLKLVAIDLEANDNAQAIFEVLNARGTELLAVDLIKNFAFREAQERGEDVDTLYQAYWRKFDSPAWRVETVVGRLRKARADQFLTYWLVAKTAREVHSQQLFPTFRSLLREHSGTVHQIIADLSAHADEFDEFGRYSTTSPEGLFFYRVSEIDINVIMPVLITVFGMGEPQLPPPRRQWALRALESWLVRRALLRAPTKDYNKVVPMLIGRIVANRDSAAKILVDSLSTMEGVNRNWPTDEQLRSHLRIDPVYTSLKRGRLRMVLEAIEDSLRGNMSEEHVPLGRLHIEHVLPQAWAEHWPLPEGAGAMAGAERDASKHRLGNLTLLTQPLNSAQSNSSWHNKKGLMEEYSVLRLSRSLREEHSWDETAIAQRTSFLIEQVLQIWPGPDNPIWNQEP